MEQRAQEARSNSLARLAEGMLTPSRETAELPLESCISVYPHL
jgi:hypothetical protein